MKKGVIKMKSKNTFFRYFYVLLSSLSLPIIVLIAFVPYLLFSKSRADNFQRAFLVFWVFIISYLFFIVFSGLIFFFQTVKISEKGISIFLFKKEKLSFKWEDVKEIKSERVFRSPCYLVYLNNGEKLRLDKRKAIKTAIEKSCPKKLF